MTTESTFVNTAGETIKRVPCEIYTRVMGYYRPVSQFNNWKKSEFYSRTYFEETISANSEFKLKYWSPEKKND